jgi:hypothetical protein
VVEKGPDRRLVGPVGDEGHADRLAHPQLVCPPVDRVVFEELDDVAAVRVREVGEEERGAGAVDPVDVLVEDDLYSVSRTVSVWRSCRRVGGVVKAFELDR